MVGMWAFARCGYEPSPDVYFWDIPPVLYLYPACILPYTWPWRYPVHPCIIDLYLAILQQIHYIPLYLTVSSCIRTYLAVSSCIPLYLIVSHRLESGIWIWQKVHSRGGLLCSMLVGDGAVCHLSGGNGIAQGGYRSCACADTPEGSRVCGVSERGVL